MDIKEEDILGGAIYSHWYYVAKGRALRQYLTGISTDEVLDVGAGSGIFSRQLLDHNICQSAVCVDPHYPAEKQELQNSKPISFVRSVPSVPQKLILMMDVLEHVDDDVALLKHYAPPQDGYVLITVPAFQFLWSGHDVFLEHRRRYTTRRLKETINSAGLEVVRIHYFFSLLFPAVVFIRVLKNVLLRKAVIKAQSELSIFPRWLNTLMIEVHDIERHLLFPFNKVAGLTIFCVCKKSSPV